MKWILTAVVLMLSLPAQAQAQPNTTTNRLINDTPSMLDFGVLRLETYLQARLEGDVSVNFDWNRNRIIVYRHVMLEPDDETDLERNCRDWLSTVRAGGLVNGITGELVQGEPYSRYAGFFGHIGFKKTIDGEDESDVLPLLDHLFTLETQFWRLRADRSAVPELRCMGELLSASHALSEGWR